MQKSINSIKVKNDVNFLSSELCYVVHIIYLRIFF